AGVRLDAGPKAGVTLVRLPRGTDGRLRGDPDLLPEPPAPCAGAETRDQSRRDEAIVCGSVPLCPRLRRLHDLGWVGSERRERWVWWWGARGVALRAGASVGVRVPWLGGRRAAVPGRWFG